MINSKKETKQTSDFPCLVEYIPCIYDEGSFIVLTTSDWKSRFSGVVVWSENDKRSVGEYINAFVPWKFKRYDGTITLEND